MVEYMYNPFWEETEQEDEQLKVINFFEKKFNMEHDQRQRIAINILVHICKTNNQQMINHLQQILTPAEFAVIDYLYLKDFDSKTNKFKNSLGFVEEKQQIGDTIKALFTIAYNAQTFAQLR